MSQWHSYEIFSGMPESTMVWVEGGSFMMGSEEYSDEKPIHEVELSSFYLGQYAVSQALWLEVTGENPSEFKGSELTVESISWNDCQEFLEKLNEKLRLDGSNAYRLPTEAEWEYVARGGKYAKGAVYAGSGELKRGWFWDFELGKHGFLGIGAIRYFEWCWDGLGKAVP